MDDIKIIYIAGYTRSGTTILSRMLGEIKGVLNLGEIYPLWLEAWIENRKCECGKPFSECEFWQGVLVKAFGTNSPMIAQRILELQGQVDRFRYLPQLFFPGLRSTKYNENLQEYKDFLVKFYQAIVELTGVKILIIPDKHIASACVISEIFNVNVVHMVRDSRAVAYSWLKKKKDPSTSGYMPIIPTYRAALEWDFFNFMGEFLKFKAKKYLRLNYSDLARSPERIIQTIADFSEIPYTNIFSDDKIVITGPGHTASGNPDRFTSGDIEIKPDEAWVSKFNYIDKAIVTLLTWPFLFRYGYH